MVNSNFKNFIGETDVLWIEGFLFHKAIEYYLLLLKTHERGCVTDLFAAKELNVINQLLTQKDIIPLVDRQVFAQE